jgi:23S rRNA (cytidine2498-2'-O)-methyltransferase
MSDSAAQFVFMTCRPGAEGALKQEVARAEPTWRLAFSRPGFLTFKHVGDSPLVDFGLAERRWTLAHAHGLSLGRITGTQLRELAQQVWNHPGVAALAADESGLADIHVWQIDTPQHESGARDEGASPQIATALSAEIESALRDAAPESLAKLRKRSSGDSSRRRRRPSPRGGRVLDVCVREPGDWWIGYHRAVTPVECWPGGQIPAPLPTHAVSRAYAKIEEAIRWSGLPVAAGDECVEIGCAPGGSCQALLERGLFVTGIDPADMDSAVLAHPRFRHLKKRGSDVRRHEFAGVRWLVADMNIAPQATLDEVETIVTHEGAAIRGMVLTLKLSDWSVAERLEEFAQRVRDWGYRDVRLRQLTSGGQEVCLVALRRKALRRMGRAQSRKRRAGRPAVSALHSDIGETASAGGQRADTPHTELSGPHF